MSRIIVKNLPKKISSNKLQELFSSKGLITDLQLKYTKAGVFRQFAFIGYKTEEEAQEAKEFYNNTFVNASRIHVEICTNLGDPNKPKPWKENQKKKLDEEKTIKEDIVKDSKKKKDKNKSEKKKDKGEIPQELLNDTQFKEFMEVHEDRKAKPVWCDATSEFQKPNSDLSEASDSEVESKDDESCPEESKSKQTLNVQLKPKIKSTKLDVSPEVEKLENEKAVKKEKVFDDQFTVKLKRLPYTVKKKHIKQFFQPLKIFSLRIPPKSKGFAYVSFKTEKDMKQALIKNKGFLEGRRIDVMHYAKQVVPEADENNTKQTEDDKAKDQELLAETGRIYVRNLCFSVAEAELEQLFSKYGKLAEIHLPVDFLTKRSQGFAFVSFVFAEHAVKAFAELDGTIFQGRLLHLIPAKPPKEVHLSENETSYKKKKEAKMKASSGSSHNWNILFLGMNAVADVIAEKYNVDKSKLLSGDSKESIGVRMALAETQVVLDTRKFLVEQGVELDAFSQPAAERSKTIIIAKNLPAKTVSKEILEVFSKYGSVAKVILPPSGMVALVEFQEPTEAKIAFRKLAYSRFRHLPLYLEWAPVNAINPNAPQKIETPNTKDGEEEESSKKPAKLEEEKEPEPEEEKEPESEEDEPEPDTTVFVKNINFDTTQESFKKHFKQCGPIHSAAISTKKDMKSGKLLSMGFGFIQFKQKKSAINAVQNMQLSDLDGHCLELKFSSRATVPTPTGQRKRSSDKKQRTSKILVRNIPFEASEKEVKDLFKEFGELKFVRLPKKIGSREDHRGFGFVEYCTKSDAKRAFEALCHSTHLYGRRLVLEWANPETDDVDELRRKTAKDFYAPGPGTKLKKRKLNEDVALVSAKMQLD